MVLQYTAIHVAITTKDVSALQQENKLGRIAANVTMPNVEIRSHSLMAVRRFASIPLLYNIPIVNRSIFNNTSTLNLMRFTIFA